ncbi:UbiX family flavin prenyltransferase [Escherichia albertii]|uniref:UbiX family flavin prenyltransferase n=1 Tax=Escherichia albertii TaxID=208962 RepID=UPI003B636CE5
MIVGISGASGFQYGVKTLELLKKLDVEIHLVVSKGAEKTCQLETDFRLDDIFAMADVVHPINNLGAAISSGSFKTQGMIITPCSMRTLGAIAHGMTDNLLARETPLNLGHIRNMATVTEMGGIIFPPVPAFYQRPQTVEEIVPHSVNRALDLFDLNIKDLPRWGEGLLNYNE